ncbi:uncharacterized protein [Dysidea avara]|uniref:uncharacterized protein n=1 Tax=Dysidea avara TaxID=196820 RepID=UPI003327A3D1
MNMEEIKVVDQPLPAYPDEKPPAYHDVYPSIPTAPPSYDDHTNITSPVTPLPTSSCNSINPPRSGTIVISQPIISRPQQGVTPNQIHNQGSSSEQKDYCGIILIVISIIAMILALPIGIHAVIYSCKAYHTNDKNNYRLVAVIIDASTFIAILLVVIVVSVTVT